MSSARHTQKPTRGERPAHPVISAHRVEGTPVFNQDGALIGNINDLMIEKVSGQITSATMSCRAVLGVGGGRFPIPWSMLTYDTHFKGYVVDEQKLHDARSLKGDHGQESDLPWRDDVYGYWDTLRYWK
ncbi:PRC-barrel domain-containing protein [Phenylobacterium sp.]|uniref:PRC-barrel domain-containing protein n=1 Tax=Phenylobacterium sp. TaxID=1871053 RepID=UPI002FC8D292